MTEHDPYLEEVEAWLTKNNVASSALGRIVAEDNALISRWRGGKHKASPEKRDATIRYIRENPQGIPGYKRKAKRSRQLGAGSFVPDRVVVHHTPASSHRTATPVPSLEECKNPEWVKATAFAQNKTIAQFLGELVELGILTYLETEASEQEDI